MSFRIDKNKLVLENGKIVAFDFPIEQTIEVAGTMVVALDVPADRSMTENVFGVSSEGSIIWQIERIAETATYPVNSYTALRKDGLDRIIAFNWNGTDVIVDLKTGKVLGTRFTK